MGNDIAGYSVDFRRCLGRGAIGIVYLATDKDGITVAAKQVDNLRSERTALTELQNSRKQLGLQHENIVKIFNIYNEEDVWVFMEYCEGGDLNRYSRNHYNELQQDRINIMTQISRGLAFLHDSKVIHRDIKPDNILIQPAAGVESVTAKLSDFGLAKFQEPEDEEENMDTQFGTKHFMAPELWDKRSKGQIEYYNSVDIYALGLTYLAIVQAEKGKTLKPKFDNIKENEGALDLPIGQIMVNRYRTGQPRLTVVSDRPEDSVEILTLKALIRIATSFRPEDRPTARQIQDCMECLLRGSPEEVDRKIFGDSVGDEASIDVKVRTYLQFLEYFHPFLWYERSSLPSKNFLWTCSKLEHWC